MSALRKEWTKEEIQQLGHDIKVAKAKVFAKHGFTTEEIAKVLDIPETMVLHMLEE